VNYIVLKKISLTIFSVCYLSSIPTADGKYCLTGGHDRTVRLWNPLRLDPAYPPPPPPRRLLPPPVNESSSSNNNYYGPAPPATINEEDESSSPLVDIDFQESDLPRALPIQTYSTGLTHAIGAIATTTESSGAQLLLAASDKTLVVTDMVTAQVKRRLQGHVGRINAVAATQNGAAYLTASYDGTVRIWDGKSPRDFKPIQILSDAQDSVTDIHVVQDSSSSGNSPIGLIRTASVDGVVRTYDVRRGLLKSDQCHAPITSMAATYDGQCLAVQCLDGTIRLLEVESGELLNTYAGAHTAGNYGLEVAIVANDATIVTGSEDGKCVFYDLVRATQVQTLYASSSKSSPTCSIAAHPKLSSVVITTNYDGSAIVWDHDTCLWDNQRTLQD
jgi:mitogen-activated protein kinase organizer 1